MLAIYDVGRVRRDHRRGLSELECELEAAAADVQAIIEENSPKDEAPD